MEPSTSMSSSSLSSSSSPSDNLLATWRADQLAWKSQVVETDEWIPFQWEGKDQEKKGTQQEEDAKPPLRSVLCVSIWTNVG